MSSSNSSPGPSLIKDEEYFWSLVTFEVEGRLFSVPAHRLRDGSRTFAAQYIDPHLAVDSLKPIVLDTTASDLRSFLKVLYPRSCDTAQPLLSQDEWISVLKLSTRWKFIEQRQMAIDRLESPAMSVTERISLARDYSIEAWLLRALEELVTRDEPITRAEAAKLGWEVAFDLGVVREACSRSVPTAATPSARAALFEEIVEDELYAVREGEASLRVTTVPAHAGDVDQSVLSSSTPPQGGLQGAVRSELKDQETREASQVTKIGTCDMHPVHRMPVPMNQRLAATALAGCVLIEQKQHVKQRQSSGWWFA